MSEKLATNPERIPLNGTEAAIDTALNHETFIHDFNNIFETVLEAAELLRNDKRWRPLAATLVRSVERGRKLLGAIPDRAPTLASIVADAVQSITDYCIVARKPRLQVVPDIPPRIGLPGSAKDWDRVFANLFLNTVEMLRKPGRISVAAREAEGWLTITVSDNGPGIREDILPRLFEPAVSSKKDAALAGSHSGLGLHIVATIVEKYAGRVSAANRERRSGAVFTIQLPAVR